MDQNFKEEILEFIKVLNLEKRALDEQENLLNERKKRFNESLQEFYKKFMQEEDQGSTSSLPSSMEVESNIEEQNPPSMKKEEEVTVPKNHPKNNEVLGKKLITPNDFKRPSIKITYADAALHPPRLNDFPELQNERKQKWIDDYQYCWNDMYSGNSLELERMGMTIEYGSEYPRAIVFGEIDPLTVKVLYDYAYLDLLYVYDSKVLNELPEEIIKAFNELPKREKQITFIKFFKVSPENLEKGPTLVKIGTTSEETNIRIQQPDCPEERKKEFSEDAIATRRAHTYSLYFNAVKEEINKNEAYVYHYSKHMIILNRRKKRMTEPIIKSLNAFCHEVNTLQVSGSKKCREELCQQLKKMKTIHHSCPYCRMNDGVKKEEDRKPL